MLAYSMLTIPSCIQCQQYRRPLTHADSQCNTAPVQSTGTARPLWLRCPKEAAAAKLAAAVSCRCRALQLQRLHVLLAHLQRRLCLPI